MWLGHFAVHAKFHAVLMLWPVGLLQRLCPNVPQHRPGDVLDHQLLRPMLLICIILIVMAGGQYAGINIKETARINIMAGDQYAGINININTQTASINIKEACNHLHQVVVQDHSILKIFPDLPLVFNFLELVSCS